MNKTLKYYKIYVESQYDINGALHPDVSGWYEDYTINGWYHNENGPARIWEMGYKQYWLYGIRYPEIKSDKEWIIKQLIE